VSLNLSLYSAAAGLTATSKAVSAVSSNISNALTEGYARRDVIISNGSVQGVSVARNVDLPLLTERRGAQAAAANADGRATSLAKIEAAFGDPTDSGSLSGRIAAFEAALVSAASRPDSLPRLTASVDAAKDVADKFNDISAAIRTAREQAEAGIGADVETINSALKQIQKLDNHIFRLTNSGGDTNTLKDERQAVVDSISDLVPLRQVPRDGDRIALFTTGGLILYDGRPVELTFSESRFVTPELSLAGGTLSGISVNGLDIPVTGPSSPLRGGALAAKFEVRDVLGPEAQSALDSVARNLIERFQDPTLDTTLGAADPGLFTDAGGAFDPTNELGLSSRLAVSTLVDAAAGGDATRLRDGLNATAPGPVGDATLLNALIARVSDAQTPASGPLTAKANSLSGLAGELLSLTTVNRQSLELESSYEAARFDALRGEELRNGVDTDAELQRLLLLEQAYGANARVISTLDDLMEEVLRL